MVVFLSFSLTGWVGAPLVQMPQLSLSVGTWIESQCRTPSLTVYLSSRSSNQGSFLLIFTHAALSSSHKYRLSNISPAYSLAWTWCLWWALRGNLCPSAAPQHCFCSTFIMRICVCVCVWLSLAASSLMYFFRSPPGVRCHTRPARRWRSDGASCWIASPDCQSLRVSATFHLPPPPFHSRALDQPSPPVTFNISLCRSDQCSTCWMTEPHKHNTY